MSFPYRTVYSVNVPKGLGIPRGSRLYKYLPRQFAEMLLDGSSVQINTLYNCRRIESSDGARSDPGEGVLTATQLPTPFYRKTPYGEIDVSGNTIINRAESLDLWLYCTTMAYDESVMREFGCDTCVVISQPDLFRDAVSHAIGPDHVAARGGPCTYAPRSAERAMPRWVMPWFVKAPEYASQREYRFCWQPRLDLYPIGVRYVRIDVRPGMLDLYRG